MPDYIIMGYPARRYVRRGKDLLYVNEATEPEPRDQVRRALDVLNTQCTLVEAWLLSRNADPNSEWGKLLAGLQRAREQAYEALEATTSAEGGDP